MIANTKSYYVIELSGVLADGSNFTSIMDARLFSKLTDFNVTSGNHDPLTVLKREAAPYYDGRKVIKWFNPVIKLVNRD